MKTIIKLIFTALVVLFFSSCAITPRLQVYYQVYKAQPTEKVINKGNSLVYEDDACMIIYNFWGVGGDMGFQFFNKSESDIFLDLEKSFYVLNGVSYDYFKNRTYSYSTTKGSTSTRTSSSMTNLNNSDYIQNIGSNSNSVSTFEKKIICIPSKTSKFINEYKVTESFYLDCGLYKYPTSKQVRSKTYNRIESPFVFSNRITYSIGDSKDLIRFENEFYISEITNYPSSEMVGTTYEETCGQKSINTNSYFKISSADMFYNKYFKTGNDYSINYFRR